MPFASIVAMAAPSLISGVLGSGAARDAETAQRDAAYQNMLEQRRQFDITQQNLAPYMEAGKNALGYLQSNIGSTGEPLPTYTPSAAFSFDPSQITNNPAYQFQLEQGTNAINRGMAKTGGLNSGNRALELQKFGSGLAAQSYADEYQRQLAANQDAYNRNLQGFNIDYGRSQDIYGRGQNVLNRYASLAGIGQTTANQLGGYGANMAGNIGNALQYSGDASANAAYNRAGAWNNALQGGISNYMLSQYLK